MRFDTSIFGIVLYLLELNTKADIRLGKDVDLEKAVRCYQGDYDAFEEEAVRADVMHWYNHDFPGDDFLDNSDE